MYSLLVEYSWQTWYRNTLKYPAIMHWALGSLRIRNLVPCPHVRAPFYTSLMVMTCLSTHVTVWNFGDIMLFWQETHVNDFRCVSSNHPCSQHVGLCDRTQTTLYGIGDSDPGHTPLHSPPGTSVCPCIKLARIMIYWGTIIGTNLKYTKLKVKTKIDYDQILWTWVVTTALQQTLQY